VTLLQAPEIVSTPGATLGDTLFTLPAVTGNTFAPRRQPPVPKFQFVPVATAFGTLNSAFGIQAGRQQLGTSGEAGSLLAPSGTTRIAAYLFNELTISPTLRLQAAARLGRADVEGTVALFPPDLLPDGNALAENARKRDFMPGSVSFFL
jgi:iron complex outermembrane receptor protein